MNDVSADTFVDTRACRPSMAPICRPIHSNRRPRPFLSVPLVMDTVDSVPTMFGDGLEAARALSRTMSVAWAEFARTGIPAAPGLPDWPTFDADKRLMMVFDDNSHVVSDPFPHLRRAHAQVTA